MAPNAIAPGARLAIFEVSPHVFLLQSFLYRCYLIPEYLQPQSSGLGIINKRLLSGNDFFYTIGESFPLFSGEPTEKILMPN
jgi:hypothetical protein